MNLQKNYIKRYIIRRYSIDELESILNQKLNNQSRNLKHYANKSLDKFMNIVVYSITEEILEQLTDGWEEDSPIPEEGLYEFIQEVFGERIIKKYDELTNMNLQEDINRIHQMMGINESRFFRRRSDVEKIKELLPLFIDDVFNDEDYNNFDEFKYQLTIRTLEYYLRITHDLYWDQLPEQEEIEFVNYLSEIFNDTIKEMYTSKIKEKY